VWSRVSYVQWWGYFGSKGVMYCGRVVHLGDVYRSWLYRIINGILTLTVPPDATAKNPLALHSNVALPPLGVHSLTAAFQFRQSQTLTVPSWPAVAMYRPPSLGSTLTLTTGPRCARSCTAGCERLGVQRVTQPFWCPRCITALWRFCVIALHEPNLVRCSTTIWPVLVS
jgi:hypothetical protein